jgi:sarcosine oxidase
MPGPQIVVIGLGATGSAALCQLARRGVHAVGIEQFEIGHDRGSSHGATRMIRLAHFERPSYVPLMRRAYVLWHELEDIVRQKLLHITGIAEIGPPTGDVVRGTRAGANADLPCEVLDADSLMRRYPVFEIPQSFVAMLQPDGGFIEASTALAANIAVAKEHGAAVCTGAKVIAVEPAGAGVRVVTDRGAIGADFAIVAAGPWLSGLFPELRLPLTVTRQVIGWFQPRQPEQFAAGRFPAFMFESEYGHHYGFPAYGDKGIKFAKHHHLGEAVHADGYERTVSAQDEAAIRAPLAQYLPAANGPLRAAETCLYTTTPDNTFIIDRLPGFPQIIIASPCCGHGFKFSPVVGEILADLVTQGMTKHDIEQFRLGRFPEG